MIHNIYDYLKHKWKYCDKEDATFAAIIGWISCVIPGILLSVIWDVLGLMFFLTWGMVGLAGFLGASWYVYSKIFNKVSEDYNHYVSEFGKHKNQNTESDEQMVGLDELFDEEVIPHITPIEFREQWEAADNE